MNRLAHHQGIHKFFFTLSQSRLCGEHFFGSLRALSITS
ncbi:Uncharacterised protein [[Flavobacterium] thermophilum]|nr:Uncharacterised protein [[Flavobacterium] thermophilum]